MRHWPDHPVALCGKQALVYCVVTHGIGEGNIPFRKLYRIGTRGSAGGESEILSLEHCSAMTSPSDLVVCLMDAWMEDGV